MTSLTIQDEISGNDIVIDRPLRAEHIKCGQLLWYGGFTSIRGWDCPAIISDVDRTQQRFKVRSLDDMVEQDRWYEFTIGPHTYGSRKSMRLVEPTEVRAYLEKQRSSLSQNVEHAKQRLASQEAKLKHFDEVLATLEI